MKQLNSMPHRFHCDLPEPLIKEIIKCKDNSQVRQVGIEWCIEQSKELKYKNVPFYTIIQWEDPLILGLLLRLFFSFNCFCDKFFELSCRPSMISFQIINVNIQFNTCKWFSNIIIT